jgi:RNA polymerase sigma-70 factor (ECF subfamily)
MSLQDAERRVTDALSGSRSAFQSLYQEHQPRVFRLALSRVGNVEAAMDIVQETFAVAWRDLRRLKNPSRFGAWVIRIASNHANRCLRDRYRDTRRVVTTTEGNALETFRDDEPRRRLWDALDGLPPLEREATILHYVSGYSYSDIVDLLSVPVSTELGRLQRARARLREGFVVMVSQLWVELDASAYDLLRTHAKREGTDAETLAQGILEKYSAVVSTDADENAYDSDRIAVADGLDVEPARILVRRFFEALAKDDFADASTLSAPNYDDTDWSKSALRAVSSVFDIGEPYQRPGRRYAAGRGVFVPYAVALADGSVRRFRAAVRYDNAEARWQLDGGL